MESATASAGKYANPSLECDIVMKGGITSGVVYPKAVTELAPRYKFRQIGGTSAGAIAAAVIAAAEHNRAGGGFDEVEKLPHTLGEDSFMLKVFRPDKRTRALFEALVAFIKHGKVGGTLRLFRWFPVSLALPLLLIPAGIVISAVAGAPAAYAVGAALAALILVLIGLVVEGLKAVRTLGENDFGICHLGPGAGTKDQAALTPWLHSVIQRAAGRTEDGSPLTFGDLWGIDPMTGNREPGERKIDLQMVTTSLSHGRPVRLPVPLQKHGSALEWGGGLLFVRAEMERYFPAGVVDHLVEKGGPPEKETAARLAVVAPGIEFHRFPIGADLPVIVGTRMSLSFPILITAVTLWELDDGANPEKPPLKRVVFSDGGITSNFPIHLFDSPLPRRPTFGLQLTSFEKGDGPNPKDPGHAVEGPPAVDEPTREMRSDIDGTFGFFTAIKDAMQNWRDNLQGELPGYRERIVHIKMARDEGGLNLAMTDDQVKQLTGRGEIAGERLLTAFSGPAGAPPVSTKHWNDHRFARYRVVMSVLERFLHSYAEGWNAEPPITTPMPKRVEAGMTAPYAFDSPDELSEALSRSKAYLETEPDSPEQSLDDGGVPRPSATLRTVPPV